MKPLPIRPTWLTAIVAGGLIAFLLGLGAGLGLGLGLRSGSGQALCKANPCRVTMTRNGLDGLVIKDAPGPREENSFLIIDPSGLAEVLENVAARYPRVPLYVTENGAAFADEVGPDGEVHDPDRVAYVDAHLRACLDAIRAGVPLRGYFAWSLMDNFEWAWGYTRRFGLVHVDYATQARTPKASAHYYAEVIRRHGLPTVAPGADAMS